MSRFLAARFASRPSYDNPLSRRVYDGPNFFWNLVCDPIAAYAGGKTFLTGVTAGGDVVVGSYDHTTGHTTSPFILASGLTCPSGNIHISVAIHVRASDQRLVVAYAEEHAAKPRVRISTNALDATAWGAEALVSTAGAYTYMTLYQLPGAAGAPFYIISRDYVNPTFRIGYAKSTDGGATFGAFTPILYGTSSAATYWRIGTDGSSALHIFMTDTDRSDGSPSSVYHMKFAGDTLFKSDGTSLGAGPVAVTSGTVVLATTTALKAVRPEGWAMSGGQPCVLLNCHDSTRTPSKIRVAVWNGSSWVVSTVVDAGLTYYGAMAKNDPYTVYLAELVGPRYEINRYTSANSGSTWATEAITGGSDPLENGAPDTPLNAASGMSAIFGRGTGLLSTDFYYGLRRVA